MKTQFQKGLTQNETDIEYTELHLAGIQRKIRNIIDKITDGFCTPDMKETLEELDRQKTFTKQKLDSLQKKLHARNADEKDLIKFLSQYVKLDKCTFEEKKKAIQAFVSKVVVRPDSVDIHSVVNIIGRSGVIGFSTKH